MQQTASNTKTNLLILQAWKENIFTRAKSKTCSCSLVDRNESKPQAQNTSQADKTIKA